MVVHTSWGIGCTPAFVAGIYARAVKPNRLGYGRSMKTVNAGEKIHHAAGAKLHH